MPSNAPQFRVVTGDSPRALLARLDADATGAALSPFDDEVIVVQSLGMERWVRQQLAMRRGAAASLRLPFPAAFCRELATAMHPANGSAALDPRFDEQALTWRIVALLDALTDTDGAFCGEPLHAPLATYLVGADAPKRYALARRIAARFDEYRLYRPELLLAWERGETRSDAPSDAEPAALLHVAWQADFWRLLTNDESPLHFARWFTTAIATLEAAAANGTAAAYAAAFPKRVAVFGVSTLPPLFVRLLSALAQVVPVTCYVLTPSESGWREPEACHALERAFGGTLRELLAALTQQGATVEHLPTAPAATRTSLLAHVQHAMRTPAPSDAPVVRTPIALDDRSLLVHECHSPVRELEVLRDQLLDAFDADDTLRPHDVLVMVPDVEVYAPLAAIVFGAPHAGQSSHASDADRVAIPYRLADRALARDASAAQALSMLLDLAGSRFHASAVLDLLTLAPVQHAAGIDASQLPQLTAWVHEAGIRWGRDGLDRGAHDLPSLEDYTWRQGLDRLVAGYATGRVDALVEGVLPVAGDTLGDAALLGHFAEWVDGLFARVNALRAPRPLRAWSDALQDTLAWLVLPQSPDEQLAYDRVQRELEQLARTAGTPLADAATRDVSGEVAYRWLSAALSGDQHDTGFLTGGLTLCAMKPMRAIPFKFIAVLGLDDRAFPRRERRAAFDLIEASPRPGDRNAKADDRQLFLDTLLCAESRLMLSWVGRSQQNNAEIAPSVVLSELLDVLDAHYDTERRDTADKPTEPTPPRRPARAHVVVSQALQPFNVRYFTATDDRLFSFDARWARSVQAAQQRREPPPFHRSTRVTLEPLNAAAPLVVDLQSLMDAWSNPARFHCTQVLQLRVPGSEAAIEDVEPVAVAGLEKFRLQQGMLDRALARTGARAGSRTLTHDDESRLAAAAGQLPPGALGPVWYASLREEFDEFFDALGPTEFRTPLAVNIDGTGWRLVGRLDGQTAVGQLRVRAARVGVTDRVTAWIAHCAYAAMGGTGPTVVRGLKENTGYAPLDVAPAIAVLDALIGALRTVQQQPLAYFSEAGAAYGKAMADPARAIAYARDAYATTNNWRRADIEDPHVALLWRGRDPFADVLDEFAHWCETLWSPLMESEGVFKSQQKRAALDAGAGE